jgi:protein SCO1/2
MEDPTPKRINPWTLWIPIILIALGVVIFYNYLWAMKLKNERDRDKPAIFGRVENDVAFVERSGKPVSLYDVKGKILIISWVYTRCSRGCAGVVGKLMKLREEYADHKNIQFISVTLDKEDTPEMLQSFASGLGIKDDANWWFVNGKKDDLRLFMTRALQLAPVKDIPEAQRLGPDDKYEHDLRVALVDGRAQLRSLCDIMSSDPAFAEFWDKKIRKDLDYLIEEQRKDP